MGAFKKKLYTEPTISHHYNDLEKDWYVHFKYKHDGRIHSFKKREGINRIKNLSERISEIVELRDSIAYDLKNGWNPILDRKRECYYFTERKTMENKEKKIAPVLIRKKLTKAQLRAEFLNRRGGHGNLL